uniref:B12-binding domain-containing protein n=1 Tax=Syphacia muris TaxID=451379 RepID=A0A0N5AFJ8_9BILA
MWLFLLKVNKFAEVEGRQPRILIAKMGKGGNDRDTMHVATSFADYGFDVDLGPRIQTADEVARHAIDADVHAIGVRNITEDSLAIVSSLVKELHKLGRKDIPVVVACDIPAKDHQKLYDAGVTAILSPKLDVAERAEKVFIGIF